MTIGDIIFLEAQPLTFDAGKRTLPRLLKTYPQDEAVLQQLSAEDPTGNDAWLTRMFEWVKAGAPVNDVIAVAHDLDRFGSALKDRNKAYNPYGYSFADAKNTITELRKANVRPAMRKRDAKYDIIYEDDEMKLYLPHNKEASCMLGAGADWCASKWNQDWYETRRKQFGPGQYIARFNDGRAYMLRARSGRLLSAYDKVNNDVLGRGRDSGYAHAVNALKALGVVTADAGTTEFTHDDWDDIYSALEDSGIDPEELEADTDRWVRVPGALDWIYFGLGPEEAEEWADAGFSPDDVAGWRRVDFSPDDAREWRTVVSDPERAARFEGEGISVETVLQVADSQWLQDNIPILSLLEMEGSAPVAEMVDFIDTHEEHVTDAQLTQFLSAWLRAGDEKRPPLEDAFKGYMRVGPNINGEAFIQSGLPLEEASAWADLLNINNQQVKAAYRDYLEAGLSAEAAQAWEKEPYKGTRNVDRFGLYSWHAIKLNYARAGFESPEDASQWYDATGLRGDEARYWSPFFRPEEAAEWVAHGWTVYDAYKQHKMQRSPADPKGWLPAIVKYSNRKTDGDYEQAMREFAAWAADEAPGYDVTQLTEETRGLAERFLEAAIHEWPLQVPTSELLALPATDRAEFLRITSLDLARTFVPVDSIAQWQALRPYVTRDAQMRGLLMNRQPLEEKLRSVQQPAQQPTATIGDIVLDAALDQLPGGVADDYGIGDIDLSEGIAVEMEHTDDPELAAEIALDHAVETNPEDLQAGHDAYYEGLREIEEHLEAPAGKLIAAIGDISFAEHPCARSYGEADDM